MRKNKNLMSGMITLMVLGIFLVSFIGAYGIAYAHGTPGVSLKIAPGDTVETGMRIQNTGSADITVRAAVTGGADIANIEQEEYNVPGGTLDTEIIVTISVPLDYALGGLHKITVETSEIGSGEGGGVTFTTGYGSSFYVEVADIPFAEKKSKPLVSRTTMIIIAVIVVLLILVFVLFRKRLFGER